MAAEITRIDIEDDLSDQDRVAIVATITLSNGERRWCYFMTPSSLAVCGDWIEDTHTCFQFGASHMVVVGAELTEDLITRAIRDIERRGELIACTRPVDETAPVAEGVPQEEFSPE